MKNLNTIGIILLILFFISCDNNNKRKETKKEIKISHKDEKTINLSSSSETLTVSEKKSNITVKSKHQSSVISSKKHEKKLSEIDLLRKKHEDFINTNPFKKTDNLSKKERKKRGIPPNKYYEQEWVLSMDPSTGRPLTENLHSLKQKLIKEREQALINGRTPGDAMDNNWVERGPNNVGGRVRAVMFDPNDASYNTVFAGGVSGGLWKNTNISLSTSPWTRVNMPENLAISVLTVDPNNSNVFYAGTGESYVGGDVNGDGVWKSSDAGATWTKIFGGISGPTTFNFSTSFTINSPGSIAGNYACLLSTGFGPPITSTITQNITLVSDGTSAPTEGCNALTNGSAISGKIALIRRGNCAFVKKVKNAQDAGAIAVIIMNNVAGPPSLMGGTDNSIIIPSIMISKEEGDILQDALLSSPVNGTINATSDDFTGNLVPGVQFINDIKIRNNGGTSEIYVAAGDTRYKSASETTYLTGPGFGLYKSVDGGANFTEANLPLTANGMKHCPNDIEIATDNTIWVSTTRSTVYNDGGGKIFSSTDGVNFIDKHTVPDGLRTQIAVSSSSPNKIYILAQLGTKDKVGLYKTTDAFTSVSTLEKPSDADPGISANDFTRGQAFYNLMLEVDPNNDEIVYVGGIDLFKSTTGGTSWDQFSHWYGRFGFQYVHADQHGMAFAPASSTRMLFGNDGGVYFSNNGGTTTSVRNNGLNVTQFYSVGVAPTGVAGLTGEYFAAGAQDNGTQYFGGVGAGVNASIESQGGDGAFVMFDQGSDKYYISNYVYNARIMLRYIPSGAVRILNYEEEGNNGAFIAPMTLDSNLDILYSDYTNGASLRVRRYANIKEGEGTVVKTDLTNALLTSKATALIVSPYTTNATNLFIGTSIGKLLKATNANSPSPFDIVWADITGPSFVGSISDIEFGTTENEILVTMHNYNVVSVWYTNDGGTTWQNKEGNLPDLPVKCILKNPLNANEVIIGTELGVWFTNTFNTTSPTWHQSYNGMSNVKVVDLDLRNDNTVFAATYGRGLFSGLFTSAALSSDLNFSSIEEKIKVYPNPANDKVNLEIPNYNGKLNVQLFDSNGRSVLNTSIEDYSVTKTINIETIQSGIYILKLEGAELNYSQKLIKN